MAKRLFIVLLLTAHSWHLAAQERLDRIENILDQLSNEYPGLNNKIDLSVSGVALEEFIRGIAVANDLNISVDPTLQGNVVNNFSNVEVKDVLMFLVRKYNLDVTFIGSIINIIPFKPPVTETPPPSRKLPDITMIPPASITMDLLRDSLYLVARMITQLSGKNVILSPEVFPALVSGYIREADLRSSLDKLAFSNNLAVTELEDGTFLVSKPQPVPEAVNTTRKPGGKTNATAPGQAFDYNVDGNLISIDAFDTPIGDIVTVISRDMNKNFFLFDQFKGNTTIKVSNVTYDEFLGYILTGTDLTFKTESGIYLIGDRNKESLRETHVFQLHHRSIDKVLELVPAEVRKGVEIKAFADLNSFILSGSVPRILEIEAILRDIDRVVPVVMIDVIIIDVKKSRIIETGIKAGLGGGPAKTEGTVFPGLNVQLTAESINKVINTFNGFGVINLGKVTPDFYVSLKLLEENGILKTRSTPKLSALNGHKATMSIGKTEYYVETQNSIVGTQNPQNIVTQQYKSVQADLSLTIIPVVSADGQVTLEIHLNQSDFTGRISPGAPPGTVSRDFSSLIRVKNEEVVILGGLEEELNNDTGSGVPVLSRIPVIKWFFSSRRKEKSKSHLNILIRPTIVY